MLTVEEAAQNWQISERSARNYCAHRLSLAGLKTFVMERTWHKGQTLRENKDGSVYLSFETNQLSQTASWVMSFTGGAKVLNPPELKDEVRAAAQRILANG